MMAEIAQQIVETWQIHNRTMLFLIDHLSDEALGATLSTRGGRDAARQLAHLVNVRIVRLKAFGKKLGVKLTEFDPKVSPPKIDLRNAFNQTGEVMAKYLEACLEDGGNVPNFKRGAAVMVGYYISHEAHHRGHALLTIKQSGIKLSFELRMKIWDWNKI